MVIKMLQEANVRRQRPGHVQTRLANPRVNLRVEFARVLFYAFRPIGVQKRQIRKSTAVLKDLPPKRAI